jgi:hypothetical protein
MSEFLFLYRGYQRAEAPEVAKERTQRWMTWLTQLQKDGHVKDIGQPLAEGGKLVSGKQKAVTDGPYAEKDIVGGYTLIEANNIAHAAELSLGCPVFEFGGAVEVRPVIKM